MRVDVLSLNRNVLIGALVVAIVVVGSFGYFTYGKGTLVVELTDPPRDWGSASKVYIRYGEVRIHRAMAGNESGWFTVVEGDSWMDLSTVLNASEVIGISRLGAGKYNLVRFEVLESVVTVDGQNYTATVSSGKLNIAVTRGGVNVEVGQTSHLVIDITPKVVGSAAAGFRVVPAVKAIPSSE
jgi:hypothetical protein